MVYFISGRLFSILDFFKMSSRCMSSFFISDASNFIPDTMILNLEPWNLSFFLVF